jgi:hypothetical protein
LIPREELLRGAPKRVAVAGETEDIRVCAAEFDRIVMGVVLNRAVYPVYGN